MKFRILFLTAAAGVLLGAGGSRAHASTSSTETNGGITFSKESGTTAPSPVDPLEPEEEIEADKEPTTGDYSIVYVSDYQFGSHTISSGDITYFAENPTVNQLDGTSQEVPNFVEVLDRSGSKNGWRLSANITGPLTSEEGATIDNVTMTFSNISTSSTSGFDESLITLAESVTLAGDTQELVTVAEDGAGETAGFWIVAFGNSVEQGGESVSMYIPNTQNIEAGTYTTSVTWTFEAAL